MTIITRIKTKLRKVSNTRPKSLLLPIPASVRDVMEWNSDTKITIDVILENDEKYVKIRTDE